MNAPVTGPASLSDRYERLDAAAEGLGSVLDLAPVEQHEQDAGKVFAALKQSGATAMLVPAEFSGGEVSAATAVRFQVALASFAPSAAIATTMHHYKIAALGGVARAGSHEARGVLRDIGRSRLLLASGGAESVPGRDLRSLGSWAVRDSDGNYRVTGLKRPCSLSSSMDLMSLMVELRAADGTPEGFAQAFVPATAPGLECEPFWRSPVFLAAESHSVRLSDVPVPAEQIFSLAGETGRAFAADCYLWFQLLIAASYVGVAHCLAEATRADRRAGSARWTSAVDDLHALEYALLDAARTVDEQRSPGEQLNAAVRARDLVEDGLGAIGGQLLRAAGGGSFAMNGLHTTLTGALNALAFHPPQRGAREGVGLELLETTSRECR